MAETPKTGRMAPALRRMLLPLALAQFICSFAGSNMNVMINDISQDLHTTVQGVQVAITLFLLVMAALMIPGGKLTDRWGRKRCFTLGLSIYAVGAVLSAAAPGLGVLILGNSILEGVGTALLIPPVYILTTMLFHDLKSRAQAFGIISGMGGIGAATGPLIGGFITTAITWRAAFVFQAVIVVLIVFLARRIHDPLPADPTRPFDAVGAILSAVGSRDPRHRDPGGRQQPCRCRALLIAIGALILVGFFVWVRSRERVGKGGAALDQALSQPHVEPRAGDAERAVADAHGDVVRRLRLSAGRAGVQRHQDRRDLHGGHLGHPRVLARRRRARQALPAANAHLRSGS